MKTNSPIQLLSDRMKKPIALGAVLVVCVTALELGVRGTSPSERLEKGIYTEETKGDLKAAGEIYRQIVEDATADRGLIAQAQLRLGLCELKLGNKPQAISAL